MAKKEQEKVTGLPAVPVGYRQLGTQVAGHTFEPSNLAAVGLLQDAGEGRVFKPLGKPECGVRELNFYESLAAAIATQAGGATAAAAAANNLNGGTGEGPAAETDLELLAALAAHVPRYYGHKKLVVNQREHTFIQLEDLTYGMSRPCVMDVKIGRRTWDPMSSEQKRAIEEQKYVVCKQNLGLCLPGFQVYQPDGQRPLFIRHGRNYGKSLDVDGFRQAMALFFNADCSPSEGHGTEILLREVLRQLRSIRTWFKRQRLLHFYASSLLICYDFDQLQRLASASTKPLHNGYHLDAADAVPPTVASANQWIRVRCIDFAHIFPAEDAQPDHNYMFGLQSLIDIVEALLQR